MSPTEEEEFQQPRWQAKAERRKEKRENTVQISLNALRPHPLNLFDLQNLVLWILSEAFGVLPKWCVIQNKHLVQSVHCIILANAEITRTRINELTDTSKEAAPFFFAAVRSGQCIGLRGVKEVVSSFLQVPLPAKALLAYESLKMAAEEQPPLKKRRLEEEEEDEGEAADLTLPPRAAYLLTQQELRSHRFPQLLEDGLPPRGFVAIDGGDEKALSSEETDSSRMLGIDCEMVQTEEGLELARVSIVDENLDVVLDEFVRPTSLVVDYLTRHSGITPELLKNAISFSEAQKKVVDVIKSVQSAILVGHSLENDLNALKLVYERVIDTSAMYPHPRGLPAKNSLAMLALKVLNVRMDRSEGHCSVDDARVTLRVALKKLARGPDYNPCAVVSRVVDMEKVLGDGRVVTDSLLGKDEQQGDWQGKLVIREISLSSQTDEGKHSCVSAADAAIREYVERLDCNDVVVVFGGADEGIRRLEKLQDLLEKCEDAQMRGVIKRNIELEKTQINDGFAVLMTGKEINRP